MAQNNPTKRRRHDAAPNPEWVLMYRLGFSQSKIAALANRPDRTVAYHLRLARAADPKLQQAHALARPVTKHSAHPDVEEAVSYVRTAGSLPPAKPTDPTERKLARWFKEWCRQARDGTLASEYRMRLNNAVPGWDLPKADKENTQWEQKFHALCAYLGDGSDWPRNGTVKTEEERAHGRWIGTQRHLRGTGKLPPERQRKLDEAMPGWSIYGTRATIMGLGGDTSSGDTAVLFIALIFVGAALFIVGLLILIAAVHRALVKIDALHVGAASGNRDSWSAARR